MPLLSPRVIGPLSECSGSVRVQGQLSGSTITIFADGVAVGSGTASWPDQIFPLSASLTAAQQITATQAVGVEISLPSPRTERVGDFSE